MSCIILFRKAWAWRWLFMEYFGLPRPKSLYSKKSDLTLILIRYLPPILLAVGYRTRQEARGFPFKMRQSYISKREDATRDYIWNIERWVFCMYVYSYHRGSRGGVVCFGVPRRIYSSKSSKMKFALPDFRSAFYSPTCYLGPLLQYELNYDLNWNYYPKNMVTSSLYYPQ